jgi:hypothetical protein
MGGEAVSLAKRRGKDDTMFGRRRPLVRAAAVGGAGYALGKRRARAEEQNAPAPVEEAAPGTDDPGGLSDAALDELGKLGELKDQGILTQAEFDAQKTKILSS